MNPTFSNDEILVFDDFLSAEEMGALWLHTQGIPLRSVHAEKWNPAWRIGDGHPLRGAVIVSSENAFDKENDHYPTGFALDALIEKIHEAERMLEAHIGKRGVDWTHFFVRPYAYSAGSGLSWHRDNQERVTGAFTYYCHPRWAAHWGGELAVADVGTKNAVIGNSGSMGQRSLFEPSEMDEHISAFGIGTYIFPKPNRLVILCSGILHCIKKVDAAAGDNIRATYQGFFFRAP